MHIRCWLRYTYEPAPVMMAVWGKKEVHGQFGSFAGGTTEHGHATHLVSKSRSRHDEWMRLCCSSE